MDRIGSLGWSLDDILSSSTALILAIISLYIVVRFHDKEKNENTQTRVVNHIVLAFYLFWFAMYAIFTRAELGAMRAVFSEDDLPSLSISFAVIAISFSVTFSILIIAHRNLFITFPIIILLGFSDLYGNLNMMTGMQDIFQNHITSGDITSTAEQIWINYYLGNNHLIRIAIYMTIVFCGFIIFLFSKARYLEIDRNDRDTKYLSKNVIEFTKRFGGHIEMIGKITIVLAILINEATMVSWRFSRENLFYSENNDECSQYRPFSIGEFYKARSRCDENGVGESTERRPAPNQ